MTRFDHPINFEYSGSEDVFNEPAPSFPSSSAATTANIHNDVWPPYAVLDNPDTAVLRQGLNSWQGFGNEPHNPVAFPYPPQITLQPVEDQFGLQPQLPYHIHPGTPAQDLIPGPSTDNYDFGGMANPDIETTGRRESATSLQTPIESSSNNQSPISIDQHRSRGITVRRDQQPPLIGNKYTCDHKECVEKGERPTFNRKSDWK